MKNAWELQVWPLMKNSAKPRDPGRGRTKGPRVTTRTKIAQKPIECAWNHVTPSTVKRRTSKRGHPKNPRPWFCRGLTAPFNPNPGKPDETVTHCRRADAGAGSRRRV